LELSVLFANLVSSPARRLLTTIAVGVIASGVLLTLVRPRQTSAISSGIVISQVYGGGGNSGATLKNDFIELFNPGNSTVDVSSWSVQYSSAAGSTWQVTNLCGSGQTCTILPGHYYLIQEAQGASGTTSLPAPDAIGSISMSAANAKVALVNTTALLSGGCPLGGGTVDFVGYGSASCFEGQAAAKSISNTTANLRINNGCTDSDNNNSDFITGAPNPRNSSSAAITCGVAASPTPTPSPNPDCGVERWSVKTGTDADASLVNLTPQSTTIATMRSWTAPATIPSNNRVTPYETTVWTVNATLVEYKLEDDSDYHIVIKDDDGNTIITEIPASGCVGSSSPFAPYIANARAKFNAMFTPTTSFQFANVPLQITGVGMFDFLHGQTGVAPNGIELHPILDISFTTAPQLVLVEDAPQNTDAAVVDLLLMRDPFDVINTVDWLNAGADRNTRLLALVTSLQLAQGEPPSSVIVNLIDSNNHSFDVASEDVRPVPNSSFTQIMFRLPDNISPGACAIRVKAHGQTTNSGMFRIRQ
jgi:hypothetical protein